MSDERKSINDWVSAIISQGGRFDDIVRYKSALFEYACLGIEHQGFCPAKYSDVITCVMERRLQDMYAELVAYRVANPTDTIISIKTPSWEDLPQIVKSDYGEGLIK